MYVCIYLCRQSYFHVLFSRADEHARWHLVTGDVHGGGAGIFLCMYKSGDSVGTIGGRGTHQDLLNCSQSMYVDGRDTRGIQVGNSG